jgi:RNA-directed DNA polymerase
MATRRLQSLLNNPVVSIGSIIELDIEGCFDNIDHNYILANIPFIPRSILKAWLTCGFIVSPTSAYNPTGSVGLQFSTGVPQGGIISPTICNMVLDGLDLNYGIPPKPRGPKSYYIRYADDMNILLPPNIDPNNILSQIKERLALRGLKASETKTKIHILGNKPTTFNFGGFRLFITTRINPATNRQVQKCLLYIKTDNIQKHKDRLREISKYSQVGLPRFISTANPIITGFCNYYRYGNCSQIFGSLSRWLYWHVRHFLLNRKGWKLKKLYAHLTQHKEDTNCPTPAGWFWKIGEWRSKVGASVIFLRRHANVKIIYVDTHKKFGSYNYYDPKDREEIIKGLLMYSHGRMKIVLKKYNGLCAYCGTSLTERPYELHHILPIQFKGPNTIKNLVPLCKYPCHYSITSLVKGLPDTKDKLLPYIEKGVLALS